MRGARLRGGAWLPIKREGDVVTVAVDDPHDLFKIDMIEAVLRPSKVTLVVAVRERILRVLDGVASLDSRQETVVDILGEVSAEPVSEDAVEPGRRGDQRERQHGGAVGEPIIVDAQRARASDIHLEPRGDSREAVIRFPHRRHLRRLPVHPAALRNPLVARLKVMAHLDIAERRKPQDGKIRVRIPGKSDIELRVATVPTVGGNEDMVLRLLARREPSRSTRWA
jgi:type II secretory ATPase GspE/PulE/Tfp pilus assembly ATPase PilB-like protein